VHTGAEEISVLFGFHWAWAVVLLVAVLILFGVGRLPSVGGALGRGINDFRRSLRGDGDADPAKDKPKQP
jgi:sec-independent protein translocase protein TatA